VAVVGVTVVVGVVFLSNDGLSFCGSGLILAIVAVVGSGVVLDAVTVF